MEITKSQKRLYCMNFYLSIYTRDRVQVFRSEKLYRAFEEEVKKTLKEVNCTLLEVIRGAENHKGKIKYTNAFLTLRIHSEGLSPEQIFQLITRNGWEAVCIADAEQKYKSRINYFTKDFLVLGDEAYDKETIYRYAYTRNEQTGADNEPGDADSSGENRRRRLYGI